MNNSIKLVTVLSSRQRVPASFLNLFQNAEPGGIWLPSIKTSIFQDAAMTIPAVVGSAVVKMLDLSGRGNTLTLTNVTLQQDAQGKKYLLPANGSGQTAAIDFTGTDKMTAVLGINKANDSATCVAMELSATSASNAGSFTLFAPDSAATPRYMWTSKGSVAANAITAISYAAPITNVLTCVGNIAGDVAQIRINGAVAQTSNSDQGTGNYGNYVLNFFARNAAGNRFNGPFYGAVVRGAATTAGQIADAERDMARLTGINF